MLNLGPPRPQRHPSRLARSSDGYDTFFLCPRMEVGLGSGIRRLPVTSPSWSMFENSTSDDKWVNIHHHHPHLLNHLPARPPLTPRSRVAGYPCSHPLVLAGCVTPKKHTETCWILSVGRGVHRELWVGWSSTGGRQGRVKGVCVFLSRQRHVKSADPLI